MDILSLCQSPTADLAILHPVTGKPVGITFTLFSRHSPEVKAVGRKIADRRMAASRKGKALDAAALEEEALELLAASVKAWSGVEEGGEPMPCTHDSVLRVLNTPGLEWIRKQVDEAMGNEALFFRD